MKILFIPARYKDPTIYEPEPEKHCPKCGSSDVFVAKHKTRSVWFGICRQCMNKSEIDTYYK